MASAVKRAGCRLVQSARGAPVSWDVPAAAAQLPLALAAVGGVSSAQDYQGFINAGADAVLCGSSPMYLPDLASEIKQSL